jgi:hypothetical protein
VEVLEEPGSKLISPGASTIAKLGALTVKVRGVEADRPPEVPVIATFAVPGAAVLLEVRVSVVPVAVGFGEKDAVTPLGRPVAAKLT